MTAPAILRSEPDISGSLHPFQERLAEVVAWCVWRGRDSQLRTAALAPPPALPWPETVRTVAEQRAQQLGRSWRRSLDPLGGGLLLVYFPTPPHSRGAAHTASEGYFDERDAPPWDTWTAYVEEPARSYMVAWVPPQYLKQATAGVDQARTSLQWLGSSDTELRRRLGR